MRKAKILIGGLVFIGILQLAMQKGTELLRSLEQGILEGEALYKTHGGENYSEELLELLKNNPETEEFVKDYPNREKWNKEVKLTKKEKQSTAPLFLQWDRRWGYALYGNKMMAVNGCGPTCLSMVLVGLKGDTSMHPKAVADYSADMGYITEDSGTSWALMTEGARALGLTAEEMPLDENKIQRALQAGQPIICSMGPGDFTTTGHFIVIYGEEDGELLIHDPNSRERSEKKWSFDAIQGQIKNLWKYSE